MRHFASPSFWELYDRLPQTVRDLADKNYKYLKDDPHHPSLHLKKIGKYWSVRIGRQHRAIAVEMGEDLLWFWIGTHVEYNALIR
jgi:hypothetical protein